MQWPERERAGLLRFRQALGASPPLWWALLYFFSLLTGYYVLRPVRDAMGASNDALTVFPPAMIDWAVGRGIDLNQFTLQILFSGTFFVMLLLQPLYLVRIEGSARTLRERAVLVDTLTHRSGDGGDDTDARPAGAGGEASPGRVP